MNNTEPTETEVVILPKTANIYSFLLFLIIIPVFGLPFIQLWGIQSFAAAWNDFLTPVSSLCITILVGMVAHEFLHALCWAAFCQNGLNSVSFGINWKNLSPFVQCNESLKLPHYMAGTLLPGIALGFLPLIFGVILGNGWILCFGIFFSSGSAGDFLSCLALRRFRAGDMIRDHPEHAGFIVSSRET